MQITNLKKDRKFTVRVLKNSSVVGICEVVLPQMLLLKREDTFTKTISISMIDSVKRALLGKDWLKTLQIVIKAQIEYKEGEETGYYGQRSSSARPLDVNSNKKRNSGYSNSTKFSNTSSSFKNSLKGNEVKPTYSAKNRGSIFVVKDKNQKPEEIDEFGEVEKSFIDSIFGEDHVTDYSDVGKTLNDFIEDSTAQSRQLQEIEDPDTIKEKAKKFVPKLFDLQKVYYQQFNKANSTHKKLREFLIKYNEKFREISKKTNRLHECLESNQIRNDMATFITREENKKINNSLLMNLKELEIYKSLFKIKYGESDLEKFKKSNENNDEVRDKNVLLKVVENLFNRNNSLLGGLPEEKKIHLSYLVAKYNLKKPVEDSPIEMKEIEEIDDIRGILILI